MTQAIETQHQQKRTSKLHKEGMLSGYFEVQGQVLGVNASKAIVAASTVCGYHCRGEGGRICMVLIENGNVTYIGGSYVPVGGLRSVVYRKLWKASSGTS